MNIDKIKSVLFNSIKNYLISPEFYLNFIVAVIIIIVNINYKLLNYRFYMYFIKDLEINIILINKIIFWFIFIDITNKSLNFKIKQLLSFSLVCSIFQTIIIFIINIIRNYQYATFYLYISWFVNCITIIPIVLAILTLILKFMYKILRFMYIKNKE